MGMKNSKTNESKNKEKETSEIIEEPKKRDKFYVMVVGDRGTGKVC